MNPNHDFIPINQNYDHLKCYQKAECIYDVTYYFANNYFKRGDRTIDQMVQAARSGKQNIAEGVEAGATSKETAIKLVNVARASLQELLVDYKDYLRVRKLELCVICDTKNGRIIKDKKQLLDLWVSNYNEVLKPKLLVGAMAFRTEANRNEWKNIALPKGMSWGGEPAANLTDGYLQPGLFDIYTEIPAAHLIRTGVVKQYANGEIHLYNKFWNWETDNRTVPAILIYADLMGSGNSRCLEAAQRILKNKLRDFE